MQPWGKWKVCGQQIVAEIVTRLNKEQKMLVQNWKQNFWDGFLFKKYVFWLWYIFGRKAESTVWWCVKNDRKVLLKFARRLVRKKPLFVAPAHSPTTFKFTWKSTTALNLISINCSACVQCNLLKFYSYLHKCYSCQAFGKILPSSSIPLPNQKILVWLCACAHQSHNQSAQLVH